MKSSAQVATKAVCHKKSHFDLRHKIITTTLLGNSKTIFKLEKYNFRNFSININIKLNKKLISNSSSTSASRSTSMITSTRFESFPV